MTGRTATDRLLRLLFLGDVVGPAGEAAVYRYLPELRGALDPDCVIVNGENAADTGYGITPAIAERLFGHGIDCITLGNHAFKQADILPYLDRQNAILRPANYRAGSPGHGSATIEVRDGRRVRVVNVAGQELMEPADNPFVAVDRQLEGLSLGPDIAAIVVDMHGIAGWEKMAMARHLDGRATLVVGTHTHIPTADAQILRKGTAYQSDAGSCADFDSITGMQAEAVMARTVSQLPGSPAGPATGEGTVCGVYVEAGQDGLARRVEAVRVGPRLAQNIPTPTNL